MCGICGYVAGQNMVLPGTELILRMMERLAHRGPDGAGYYSDERAVIGHTRLSIIDGENGAQPLSNEDGSIWITFNGEIFNYKELSEELQSRGHVMKTASDTEIIVHAWEEWGEGCFNRFNGQWAFALWDRMNGTLIISRDPTGILPLHYTFSRGLFLFASEVKALFADSSVQRQFDPEGLAETFSFWCTVAPRTVYRDIYELEPGCFAVVQNGAIRRHAYWHTSFPTADDNGESLVESGSRLRECLINAARLRFLRSDVPVGAYLSGGIDSSITAAIISKYTSIPLRTFSIRFADDEFDEGRFQSEMAVRLGTDHRDVRIAASDIAEAFPEVIWHGEKPILRSAPAPLYILSRLVRKSGYKVVVTGEGADEMFAGYDIFRELKVRLFLLHGPDSAKRAKAVELLYPWLERSPANVPSFARSFFEQNLDEADLAVSHRPRWRSTEAVQGLLTPQLQEQVGAYDAGRRLLEQMPPDCIDWDPVARAQWLEIKTLLPGYILSSQGDRMLMANSVEGRFPFLDPEVMKLAHGLPMRYKLMALDEKHILKKEFSDLIPESIRCRPKQPYRAPDASSFFGPGGNDWIDEIVSDSAIRHAEIFNPLSVSGLVKKCRRVHGERMSNTDNMRILAVLSTMLAFRYFIEGDGGNARGITNAPPHLFDRVASTRGKEGIEDGKYTVRIWKSPH